jgi:hypothetical protein
MTEYLYHYTSLKGLKGILESDCLWATDAFKSNDLTEIKFGGEILKKKLIESGISKNDAEKFIEVIYKGIKEKAEGVFLTCFSGVIKGKYQEDNGVLSQWRGYGSYAIKFDQEKLKLFLEREGSTENFKDWLGIADLDDGVKYFDPTGNCSAGYFEKPFVSLKEAALSKEKFLELEEDDFKKVIENFCICLILSKHVGFEEESERRCAYIVWKGEEEIREVTEIYSDKSDKKYIKRFVGGINNAIESVIIGPMSDADYKVGEIFLSKRKIKFRRSETPFLDLKKSN